MADPESLPAPEMRDVVAPTSLVALEQAIGRLSEAALVMGCLSAGQAAAVAGGLELLPPENICLHEWLETSIRGPCGQCGICQGCATGVILSLPSGWTPVSVNTNCMAAYREVNGTTVLAAWRGCLHPALVIPILDMWRLNAHLGELVVSADVETNTAWRVCMGQAASVWVGLMDGMCRALVLQAVTCTATFYSSSNTPALVINASHRDRSCVEMPLCTLVDCTGNYTLLVMLTRSVSAALQRGEDAITFAALPVSPRRMYNPVTVFIRLPPDNGIGITTGVEYNINIVSAWGCYILVTFSRVDAMYQQVSTVCALAVLEQETVPVELEAVQALSFNIVQWEQASVSTIGPDTLKYVYWDALGLSGPVMHFCDVNRHSNQASLGLHDHKIQFIRPGRAVGPCLTHINETCTVVSAPPAQRYCHRDVEGCLPFRPIRLLPMGQHTGVQLHYCIENGSAVVLM